MQMFWAQTSWASPSQFACLKVLLTRGRTVYFRRRKNFESTVLDYHACQALVEGTNALKQYLIPQKMIILSFFTMSFQTCMLLFVFCEEGKEFFFFFKIQASDPVYQAPKRQYYTEQCLSLINIKRDTMLRFIKAIDFCIADKHFYTSHLQKRDWNKKESQGSLSEKPLAANWVSQLEYHGFN